jgi:hypothetical protein
MAVTCYVALPFVRTEEGTAPGEAQEMPLWPIWTFCAAQKLPAC